MFKNVFTICVDMDDTIENLLDTWVAWLNDKYNLNVAVDDCKSWQLSHVYPSLSDEQIFEPLSIESFWSQVKPKSDAQYYINKLIEDGQEIYICTASHYDTVAYKMRAIIEKYFPKAEPIKNTEKVSSICCDVIGDICGIVSGSISASLVVLLLDKPIVSILLTAIVSSFTVGGKAIGKIIAIERCEEIVFVVGKILSKIPVISKK